MTNEEILDNTAPRGHGIRRGGRWRRPRRPVRPIRLKQLAAEKGQDVSVVVLEKGSGRRAHPVGAIMDPKR